MEHKIEEWIENGEKVEPWGGNMEMSIVFQKDNGGKETGNFVMFKDDATVDQGGWESEKVRKDFSL